MADYLDLVDVDVDMHYNSKLAQSLAESAHGACYGIAGLPHTIEGSVLLLNQTIFRPGRSIL